MEASGEELDHQHVTVITDFFLMLHIHTDICPATLNMWYPLRDVEDWKRTKVRLDV